MKAKVYYVSPKESAMKVAEVIASVIKLPKEPLMPAYMPEGVSLMFIGCEGNKADKVTTTFINSLNNSRIHNAALFCTNPSKSDAAITEMRNLLTGRGIKVLDKTFVCQGKGFMGKHPSSEDLTAARTFAEACVKQIMG